MRAEEAVPVISKLCDKADRASAEFLSNIPSAIASHGLPKVQKRLAAEVHAYAKALNTALAQLPTSVRMKVTNAASEAGASIADTKESVKAHIQETLSGSGVASDAIEALQNDLTNHRRRFAKMRAVLQQTDLWEAPLAQGPDSDIELGTIGDSLINMHQQ